MRMLAPPTRSSLSLPLVGLIWLFQRDAFAFQTPPKSYTRPIPRSISISSAYPSPSSSCLYQSSSQQQDITFDPAEMKNPPDDVPKNVTQKTIETTINRRRERTLYDILGADPSSTRAELKKSYAQMAKQSHPDGRIGQETTGDEPDFTELAAAWRVLGDAKTRQRYDRELKAKEFSINAQKFANEKLEEAVPAVAKMMDQVAVPFLRRTTATTWAVGQAVAEGVSKVRSKSDEDASWRDAFKKAVQAGQQAGRVIDSIELDEKSKELEKRAKKEQGRANKLVKKLGEMQTQRLFGTLQSSNFALSSDEAKEVLNCLDIDDTVSIMDRAMMKTTIEKDIESLKEAEQNFSEKLVQYEENDREWNELLKKQEGAKTNLKEKKQEEIIARQAFDQAQRMVVEAKAALVTTESELRGVEQRVRKNANEMDRVTSALSKKQEKVRNALKKKAEMVNSGIQVEYLSEDDLTRLRRQEIQLMGESKQVERMVARLHSRAAKLRNRADALEKWQKSGQIENAIGSTSGFSSTAKSMQ